MQRVIILPADGFVSIDGRGFTGLDLSALDPDIHAVQWYGSDGELELVSVPGSPGANIAISDLAFAQPALDAWQAAADAEDNPPPLSIADYAAAKLSQIDTLCRAHITGGVVSNALGSGFTYPTNNTAEHPDQQNLNALVTSSLLNAADPAWERLFWCADSNGIWDRRPHNHAQIQEVGMDVETHVVDAQNKIKQLSDQLQTIVAFNQLTPTDPNYATDYLDDDAARAAIDAVNW